MVHMKWIVARLLLRPVLLLFTAHVLSLPLPLFLPPLILAWVLSFSDYE